mmetsp:Transcript_25693/g.35477  ORF Transcript_25693/g.35477 Transcript_25693/m.35477 type:complete len:115 (+) Transcript_25693:287-631(+)|eukprot:CAMPEP_0196580578 /NCGR_PEP_ID=MMETSP1081-20130531/29435_1 /TAXON_ID=36882 /ORGANISM="Pyramimonas amylifera, Strain CCMP720" /LENGTH=114 /DNA_ID=CAMNT_0041900485 /DNA_START=16 /DNA_END=360 /DNA_ORIENTATION=+
MGIKSLFKSKKKGSSARGDDSDPGSDPGSELFSSPPTKKKPQDSHAPKGSEKKGNAESELRSKVAELQRELDSKISAEKKRKEELNLMEFKQALLVDMFVAQALDNDEDRRSQL